VIGTLCVAVTLMNHEWQETNGTLERENDK
jgi:hypothetical protein